MPLNPDKFHLVLIVDLEKPFPKITILLSLKPYFNPGELGLVMPATNKEPYDMMEVIARLVDSSLFWEFKPG